MAATAKSRVIISIKKSSLKALKGNLTLIANYSNHKAEKSEKDTLNKV